MAVSGRKGSGFQGSLSLASEEDFDHKCDPCLTIGQHIEAHGYCVECQEYLCKNCFSYHQRTKASRDHQLLDKDDMDKHSTPTKQFEVFTEKCAEHKNELIKFFCPEHEALGCNDCIILKHRSCDIDYIPDKCADIQDSDEYWEVMLELGQRVKEINDVMKLASNRDNEIESCYDSLIKEIVEFRREINDCLDALQKKVTADADRKKSTDKQIIQNVLQTCAVASSNFSKLQSSLQDNKTSKKNGQLYINIKKAKLKLKSKEVKKAHESLGQTNMQYKFERSHDMDGLLSKADMLGQLNLSTRLTFLRKEQTFENMVHKADINVKTRSDKVECNITGCAVFSSNKLVLSDNSNNKLKVVDTQSRTMIEEKSLESGPFDIAVLPQDRIAVTMPKKREVLVVTTASILSTVRTIPVQGRCRGICYHHGRLFVACVDPSNVFIFDTLGNVRNTISLKNEIFREVYYIALNEDSTLIYLSTGKSGTSSVVGITLQGDISAIYKHKDLISPQGMLVLDDGSLLVCCNWNPSMIHHLSGDLKRGQTKYTGMFCPHSICLSRNQDEINVYIGTWNDKVHVFSIE